MANSENPDEMQHNCLLIFKQRSKRTLQTVTTQMKCSMVHQGPRCLLIFKQPSERETYYNVWPLKNTIEYNAHIVSICVGESIRIQRETRNILKKDIRRLSNTDDKRNQIR